MNTVTLRPNGHLELSQHAIGDEPLPFLNHALVFGKDITLRTYFRMLEHYPVLTRINSAFSMCLQQYETCPDEECTSDEFDFLEFSKSIEMIGFPGDPRLEIFTSLKTVADDQRSGIEPFPLQRLLDMSLQLGSLKHVVFGDQVDVFEFETVYSLFEFVDGIGWALSFQNLPIICELRR